MNKTPEWGFKRNEKMIITLVFYLIYDFSE
jgi:hypothetical protein